MATTLLRIFALIGVLASFGFAAAAIANESAPGSRDGVYQIVKATDDRIWRLNTQTGEVAVCNLDGNNLICTTTSDAAQAPKKSFEQIEAERNAEAAEQQRAREEKRAQDLQMLDKILVFVRELIQTALGGAEGNS